MNAESILAGDRADVEAVAEWRRADYVAQLCARWEAEAGRLAESRACIGLQDLYRLRARKLRQWFNDKTTIGNQAEPA